MGAHTAPRRDQTPDGLPFWLVPIRDRLGTVQDRVLAQEAGVSVVAVLRWRQRLGVQACRRWYAPMPWVDEIHARLGVLPDAEIARAADVSPQRIQQLRVGLGIVSSRAQARDRLVAGGLLGVVSDVKAARLAGVCAETVGRVRDRLGIPAAPRTGPRAKGARGPFATAVIGYVHEHGPIRSLDVYHALRSEWPRPYQCFALVFSRAVRGGQIDRIGRGLYDHPLPPADPASTSPVPLPGGGPGEGAGTTVEGRPVLTGAAGGIP